jgi:hypothetical protein
MKLTRTEAGHGVPAYQPETAYEVFMRAMTNRDIATGNISTAEDDGYSTTGTSSVFQIKNEAPEPPAPTCYVRAFRSSCTEEQQVAVLNGTALVRNWVVIDNNTVALGDGSNSTGTSSGEGPSSPAGSDIGDSQSGSSTGSSTGGATSLATLTGEGFVRQAQLRSLAFILAVAVACVL